MKKFKEFIEEGLSDRQLVHRIDDTKINNFNSKLNTYHHTPDWTESGQASPKEKPEAPYIKSKGMFGSNLHGVAPYASPRGTRFTQHWDDNGNSNLTFQQSDKPKIEAHRPIVSSFPKNRFKHLENSGEHFSETPGTPVKQTVIKSPVQFMKNQRHNVTFVNNLDAHKKELEKNNIPHNAEGEFN